MTTSLEELERAKPRRWIEENLWIMDQAQQLIRLQFDGNQDEYDRRIFGVMESYEQALEAFCLKDRGARWTTWVNAVAFAYVVNFPGVAVLECLHDDDAAKNVGKMLDTFYNNLRPQEKPEKGQWDAHYREIRHGPVDAMGQVETKATSAILVSTAHRRDFGRSFRPKIVILDEMGAYAESYEQGLMTAVMGAVANNYWLFKGSTSGGPRGLFYNDWKDIKAGTTQAVYLFRRHFDRPENALPPAHPLALTADRGELVLTTEEKELALLFPPDVAVADRIRWRRRKIHDETVLAYGDESYGRGIFLREHPERDYQCFMVLGNPEIDPSLVENLERLCASREPKKDSYPVPGVRLRIWEERVPGSHYVAGMDPAEGLPGKDKLCLQIIDARRGTHVAELHGLCPYGMFTEQACALAESYNQAILAIERNGNGLGAIEVAQHLAYPRLYRAPSRVSNIGRPPAQPEPYGFSSTESSQRLMYQHTRDGLASGQLLTYCPELVHAWSTWLPGTGEHLPDRLAAFMIAQEIARDSRGNFGVVLSGDESLRRGQEPVSLAERRSTVGFWGYS